MPRSSSPNLLEIHFGCIFALVVLKVPQVFVTCSIVWEPVVQWFSDLSMYQNYLEGELKHR